jgi:hypothetical protein
MVLFKDRISSTERSFLLRRSSIGHSQYKEFTPYLEMDFPADDLYTQK